MNTVRLPREQRPALATFTGLLAVAALLTPLWWPEPDRASGLLLLGGVGAELVAQLPVADVRRAAKRMGERGLHAAARAGAAEHLLAGRHRAGDLRRGALRARRAQARERSGAPGRRGKAVSARCRVDVRQILPRSPACCCSADMPSNWIVGIAAGCPARHVTINLTTEPSYSERDADESVIADIGLDRPERLAETGARLQSEEQNRVPPIAGGSRRSSPSCSPFT